MSQNAAADLESLRRQIAEVERRAKASWIFTTNDVIANIGVIIAALLVYVFHSAVPDLVVATGIAFVVLSGAVRILRLKG